MKIVYFLFASILFKSTTALLFNGNSTWKDFLKCKELDVSDGYNYRQFFRIDEFTQKAATELSNDIMINIEIAVLATRDAHILLSTIPSPTNTTPVYEIVLGGGSNTFSEIRRFKKTKPLKTKTTPNILSVIRPIPINIVYKRMGETGRLDIFTNGEPFALLSYTDPSFDDFKYISFCSWGSAEAKWFYDCEPKEDSSTNILVAEPRQLTVLQQLREKFWSSASFNGDEPENGTEVDIKLDLKQLQYAISENEFMIRGIFYFKWHDSRNGWDPESFANISIYRGTVPIWYPRLTLINGQTKDDELDTGFKYTIYDNGSVEAISKPIDIITWCGRELRMYSWPNEDYYCSIQFAKRNKFEMPEKFLDMEKQDHNGNWQLISVDFEAANKSLISIFNGTFGNDEYNSIHISFYMRRNQDLYGKLFFRPLIASLLLISISFWSDHPYRCGLSLLGITIQVGVFLMMTKFTPFDYVPIIVRYYQFAMCFSWFSIVFMIISLWFTKCPPGNPPKLWILDTINSTVMRAVLALDVLKTKVDINEQQWPWIELTKIFDRLLFILNVMFMVIVFKRGY